MPCRSVVGVMFPARPFFSSLGGCGYTKDEMTAHAVDNGVFYPSC